MIEVARTDERRRLGSGQHRAAKTKEIPGSPVDSKSLTTLDIVLTAGCNLSCSYCYQNTKNGRVMDRETLRQSLDLLLASPADRVRVNFIGGEPLLRYGEIRWALDYVAASRRPGQRFGYTLATNGLLLDRDRLRFFAEQVDVSIQLSFDGVAESQVLRGESTFAKLDTLLDETRIRFPAFYRQRLRIAMTVSPDTLRYLGDSVKYFLAKDLHDLDISPIFTDSSSWRVEDIELWRAQLQAAFDASVDHFVRTGRIPVSLFRGGGRSSGGTRATMCGVTRGQKIAIDVDGSASGCLLFVDSYQKLPNDFLERQTEPARLGSVFDPEPLHASRTELRRGLERSEIFMRPDEKYSSYGRCADCEWVNSCSVCPMSIGHSSGNRDPRWVPDFLCAFNLVSLPLKEEFPRAGAAPFAGDQVPRRPWSGNCLASEQIAMAKSDAGLIDLDRRPWTNACLPAEETVTMQSPPDHKVAMTEGGGQGSLERRPWTAECLPAEIEASGERRSSEEQSLTRRPWSGSCLPAEEEVERVPMVGSDAGLVDLERRPWSGGCLLADEPGAVQDSANAQSVTRRPWSSTCLPSEEEGDTSHGVARPSGVELARALGDCIEESDSD